MHRRFNVTVPVEEVMSLYEKRLDELAKKANIKGFRPGKAPLKVIKQFYGKSEFHRVCGELMETTFQKAIVDNHVHVAGMPKIEPGEMAENKPLEYTATFEIFPDIKLNDFSQLQVERLKAEISDEDVNEMLEKLRKEKADWVKVDRAAQKGDQVVIDFEGSMKGELFEGGSAKGFILELGSGSLIPGFEDSLLGLKEGEEKVLKLEFPADYHVKDLSGQPVEFKVQVQEVKESVMPELNEEFLKKLGLGDKNLEDLRAEVKKGMEGELQQALLADLKNRAFKALLEANPIELPQAAIDQEISNMQQQTRHRMQQQMQSKTLPNIELPRDLYEEQARRRVSLGLLLSSVIKEKKIHVDSDKVHAKVNELASHYQKPEEVAHYYLHNKQALLEIESMLLEEQAVEEILSKAAVIEKLTTYKEILNQASDKKE